MKLRNRIKVYKRHVADTAKRVRRERDHHARASLLSRLRVWANDVTDWVIAESAEDADAIALKTYGGPPDEPHDWHAVHPDRVIPVHMDDGRGRVCQTALGWIHEQGRGFLASTEW